MCAKMINHKSALASVVVLIFLAIRTSADGVCDIRVRFHENVAGALTDAAGVRSLDGLRRELRNVCTDPKAHDGIIVVLDAVAGLTTDPNVSRSAGKSFYWARRAVEDAAFRRAWNETARGVNGIFDRAGRARTAMNALFDNLTRLLDDPNFDALFEPVVTNVGNMVNTPKNLLYRTVSKIVREPDGGTRPGRPT